MNRKDFFDKARAASALSSKIQQHQHILDLLQETKISEQTLTDVVYFLSLHYPDELKKFAEVITQFLSEEIEKLEAQTKSIFK